MRKQVTILLLFFFNCIFIWAQTWMKTTTPCDKELLIKTPGEWMKPGYGYHATVLYYQDFPIEKLQANDR